MNIQINTDQKTILLLSPINLKELFKELDILIPSEEWKDYQISTLYYNFGNPIYLPPYTPPLPIFSDPPFKVTCGIEGTCK